MVIYQGDTLRIDVDEAGVCELCFDLQGASVNKFDAHTLAELAEAVARVHGEAGIRGMVMTSAKKVFVVGADITEFPEWFARPVDELIKDVMAIHDTFSAIEDLPFPTVAAINGYALGGGFEVTLAADYRVMSANARVGLPEVKLGIFPGWGGTIRLPRLIGLDNAIEWIGRGQEQRPEAALRQGAVDSVVEPDRLRSSAVAMLQLCIDGGLDYQTRRREKRGPVALDPVERRMVFETTKANLAGAAGPHYPAATIALECMERHVTLTRDEAARIEAEAFAEAARTETAASLVGLFLNDQFLKREAKRHAKPAGRIDRAAVLGAGIMGGGIAYQTAFSQVPVTLKDISRDALTRGLNEACRRLTKRVERGVMDPKRMGEVLNRIDPTLEYGDIADADIVIEAVVENETTKKTVLAEMEQAVHEDTILATNTSTIAIDALATSLRRPQRFCGMHFFNPIAAMPLVEVIRGRETSEQTIATTVGFALAIGKNPIVVNDCPGFLVNRILFSYFAGFELLLRDGADFARIDRVMERLGWPMGPAHLLDVIGTDTAHRAAEVLAAAYAERMGLPFRTATTAMFETGRLGQKSGSGYYRYQPNAKGTPNKVVDDEALATVARLSAERVELSDQDIAERLMLPMCLEAARCLEESVVDSPVAVDMGLIWGIGFPSHLGGALRYIDRLGASRFCDIAAKYAHLGKLYEPTEDLRQRVQEGRAFF